MSDLARVHRVPRHGISIPKPGEEPIEVKGRDVGSPADAYNHGDSVHNAMEDVKAGLRKETFISRCFLSYAPGERGRL